MKNIKKVSKGELLARRDEIIVMLEYTIGYEAVGLKREKHKIEKEIERRENEDMGL